MSTRPAGNASAKDDEDSDEMTWLFRLCLGDDEEQDEQEVIVPVPVEATEIPHPTFDVEALRLKVCVQLSMSVGPHRASSEVSG